MKRAFKKFVYLFLSSETKTEIDFFGPKRYLIYFLFQRILRINSRVPWPVHHSSIVSHPDKIKRKKHLPFLGDQAACYIQAKNGIEIGENVRSGPNVHIISANHELHDYDLHSPSDPIRIGDNCWLGSGAVILSGVHLADHVVVAAGSVVTKSFPKNVLIGGVPAKVIKELGDYEGDSNWGPQY